MRVLGVGETAIQQPQAACHDQQNCQNLDCVHFIFSGKDTRVFAPLATGKPGKTETVKHQIALPDHLVEWKNSGSLQAPALHDTYQDHNDRDDQQNVYEPAHGVRGNQANQPKDD
jgi:hypothetical protein